MRIFCMGTRADPSSVEDDDVHQTHVLHPLLHFLHFVHFRDEEMDTGVMTSVDAEP